MGAGALSLSLLPISSLRLHQLRRTFPPKPNSSFFFTSPLPAKSSFFRSSRSNNNNNNRGGRNSIDESSSVKFSKEEDGGDMEGFLDSLSLEYDSVWDTKPSWCQPWTILLTGITVVAFSWLFLHSAIISTGVFCIICAWWYIFLYAYPKAYSEMIAERRSKVTSGTEDTFGVRKSN